MNKISNTALVSQENLELFFKQLNENIKALQDMGLEIEVQYQFSGSHSALIIGRKVY